MNFKDKRDLPRTSTPDEQQPQSAPETTADGASTTTDVMRNVPNPETGSPRPPQTHHLVAKSLNIGIPTGFVGIAELCHTVGISDPKKRQAFEKELSRLRKSGALTRDDCREVTGGNACESRFVYRADSDRIRELAQNYTEPRA